MLRWPGQGVEVLRKNGSKLETLLIPGTAVRHLTSKIRPPLQNDAYVIELHTEKGLWCLGHHILACSILAVNKSSGPCPGTQTPWDDMSQSCMIGERGSDVHLKLRVAEKRDARQMVEERTYRTQ